jgi:hypothetical protein
MNFIYQLFLMIQPSLIHFLLLSYQNHSDPVEKAVPMIACKAAPSFWKELLLLQNLRQITLFKR